MILKDVNKRYTKETPKAIVKSYGNALGNINLNFGFDYLNTLQSDEALIKAFTSTPEVYGVINYLITAKSKVPFIMKNAKGEIITKHQILDLLKKPNDYQSWHEFLKQNFAYDYVVGNSFMNIYQCVGFKPQSLFNLPTYLTQIITKDNVQTADFRTNKVTGYKYLSNGIDAKLIDANNILHRKRINLNFSNGQYLLGVSPLLCSKMPINSLISGYEAQMSILQSRGAMGVLSSKVADMPIRDKKGLYQEYYNSFGLGADQNKVMITNEAVDYIQMGLPISELQINETNLSSFEAVGVALNFNISLLKNTGASTRDNILLFEKQLWSNCLVPELNDFYVDLTNSLKYFWKEDFTIEPDFSSVESLRKDSKLLAETHKIQLESGQKTPNQIIEENGGERSTLPEMDMYYIAGGLKPINQPYVEPTKQY